MSNKENEGNINEVICANVKKYRLLNNLTQEKLAEMLGFDTQYYAHLERGIRKFTIDRLTKLCKIFHIGIEKLIEIDPDEKQVASNKDLDRVIEKLETLSQSQLMAVEKFIDEFVVFIK